MLLRDAAKIGDLHLLIDVQLVHCQNKVRSFDDVPFLHRYAEELTLH